MIYLRQDKKIIQHASDIVVDLLIQGRRFLACESRRPLAIHIYAEITSFTSSSDREVVKLHGGENMHKYLFLEIGDGNKTLDEKILDTREAGIKRIEQALMYGNNEVQEVIYKDKRRHQQEFVCGQGVRFLIYRI